MVDSGVFEMMGLAGNLREDGEVYCCFYFASVGMA